MERFRFEITQQPIQGSGGFFAVGSFARPDRRIRFWARYENLRVDYCVGDFEFDHHTYMRALSREKEALFPGIHDDTLFGGFRRLLDDLDYGDEFLSGDTQALAERVKALPPEKTGFAALG
ncbi:MAG: hypothetical protein E6G94_16815 [Alphaproteobacteria bacterium]|nr:MAG: hypothetical protein E6G94_16815 [Alphaproteobacteria bacterium]